MQLLKCFATNDITKPSHPFTPYDSTTTQVCGSDCSLLAGHSNSPKRPCHMKCCHAKFKSNEGWPSQPHRKAGSIVPRTWEFHHFFKTGTQQPAVASFMQFLYLSLPHLHLKTRKSQTLWVSDLDGLTTCLVVGLGVVHAWSFSSWAFPFEEMNVKILHLKFKRFQTHQVSFKYPFYNQYIIHM